MMRKVLLSSMVLLTLALAAPASARTPVREVVGDQGSAVIVGQCAFPVLGDIDGHEIVTTYVDAAGTPVKQIAVFPANTLTLTNLYTGASIVISGGGAGAFQLRLESEDGDTSLLIAGRGPVFPHPLTGEPGIWYLSGRARATFDADGNTTSGVITGSMVNLCDQLA